MTLGIVYPTESGPYLEGVLRDVGSDRDEKRILSAYAVLLRLGSGLAKRFSKTAACRELSESYDGGIALFVVEAQWDFWVDIASARAI
jgi:hypothetical protein